MKNYKKILIIMGVSLAMLNTGCSNENQNDEKENRVQRELDQKTQKKTALDKKVEKSFEEHLKIYPVNNLDDFYDMEGFWDEEFDKDDKGTWVLSSGISYEKNNHDPIISNDVVLFINKNTKKSLGTLYFSEYNEKDIEDRTEKYNFKVVNNQFIFIDKPSKKAKEFLNNFKFLVQDESIGKLSNFKMIRSRHNLELPLYTLEYYLPSKNNINNWIQSKYHIEENDAKFYLEKNGVLSGSSLGDLSLEIRYENKNGDKFYFNESVNYDPSRSE
ncbi:tandem-type lipoprotein [Macrococcoides canis]|uniref:Csa1 family protein n=1 Tax=Macrococcoides canis TaxID=1855823 RepID=UPI001F288525|nr:Csa1 family protein [Macrococcus canis]UJS27249.1 tandem-type lipoprotein [Macrococcus canis]